MVKTGVGLPFLVMMLAVKVPAEAKGRWNGSNPFTENVHVPVRRVSGLAAHPPPPPPPPRQVSGFETYLGLGPAVGVGMNCAFNEKVLPVLVIRATASAPNSATKTEPSALPAIPSGLEPLGNGTVAINVLEGPEALGSPYTLTL